jgi:Cu/Ag efflux protein CusF
MTLAKMLIVAATGMMVGSSALAVELTNDGKILAVDNTGKTVKIEHGPPVGTTGAAASKVFTYDYKVRNTALLDGLRVGDKVRFTTEGENQDWTVTKIQKQ